MNEVMSHTERLLDRMTVFDPDFARDVEADIHDVVTRFGRAP